MLADGSLSTDGGWSSAAFFDSRHGAKRKWLKLGRKKRVRMFARLLSALPVADSRKQAENGE